MSEQKKPSGSFYRKRKLQQAAEEKKQALAMKRFVIASASVPCGEPCTSADEAITEVEKYTDSSNMEHKSGFAKDPLLAPFQIKDRDHPNTLEISYDDPGNWPEEISDNVRQTIVTLGPVQVKKHDFPTDGIGRRFNPNNYSRKLSNGETVSRTWLVYSINFDKIFCFCCRLFSKVRMSLSSSSGYSDWIHMSQLLSEHEKSPAHMNAYQSWMELNNRMCLRKTIDAENQRLIESEITRWSEVLKQLIYAIEYLASQNLAFRGQSDRLFERNNGNFLKLVECISKFDFVMSDHLRRVTNKETYIHYLGKDIQNQIIGILASSIKDNILNEISKATYYSIILDCTPDMSHVEQMTFVIRFVKYQSGEKADIREHFLGLIPVSETTGESLTNALLKHLEDFQILFRNLRGQGYDNGSNMKGKYLGVQKRILDINPRAFFVPCGAHSLNLVVNDAALCNKDAVSFFGIVQEVYNFFGALSHRWEVLKTHISDLTVKPLSETRWESRINAIQPLRYQLGEIFDALFKYSEDNRRDAYARNTAASIAKKLKSYQFICCLVTWHLILFRINLVSKKLQEVDMDITKTLDLICATKNFFVETRTDEGFEKMLVDCREVAEMIDVEPVFPEVSQLRPRKVKRQFSYESEDERILDPKAAFKSNFFFFVLDQTISSLSERFDQLQKYNQLFGFLHPKKIISESENEDLLKNCKDLHLALTDGQHSDVEGAQLYEELKIIKSLLKNLNKNEKDQIRGPINILNFISENRFIENFPNLTVALRILLTLPVSVATGERSFSKLKIIKNYLRSSMSQDRLVDLSIISIESSVLEEIDINSLVVQFADKKARKAHFSTLV